MLKGKVPVFIALALALMAGVSAFLAVRLEQNRVRAGWNLVPVLVASEDIPEGTMLTAEMIAAGEIPEQFRTKSVVAPENQSYIVEKLVLVPIHKGDPILWTHFESSKSFEKLSYIVQKKGRAVTITAADGGAVGGWVRPNDHVDVLGTFRDPASGDQVTVTLLQNVVVLATGKITGTTNVNLLPESSQTYTNVSLLVLPEEAELLVLAEAQGKLTLSLRNPEDIDTQDERGRTSVETLLTGERMKALHERRAQTIQVIRGIGSAAEKAGPAGDHDH
jgi:pilus assembly protein CpaB